MRSEEDPPHVRIGSTSKGFDIENTFKRLFDASMLLESELDFSYDDHLGFITSCPSLLGTGLKIEIELKVPYMLEDRH